MVRRSIVIVFVLATATLTLPAFAQTPDIPADYQQVLSTLGKQGDFKDNVHVHGHGSAVELAKKLKPAIDLIGKGSGESSAPPASSSPQTTLNTARLAEIVGAQGEHTGAVYKFTLGRSDLKVTEMGAPINARMGLNTWAAFTGTDEKAAIAGDVAMLETEVTPVLKALRKNGLDVVAIHHHMTSDQPVIIFLHYWGAGPADKLAMGFKAAVNELGKHSSTASR